MTFVSCLRSFSVAVPREYSYLARVNTSIALPAEFLDRVDRVDSDRSAFLNARASHA